MGLATVLYGMAHQHDQLPSIKRQLPVFTGSDRVALESTPAEIALYDEAFAFAEDNAQVRTFLAEKSAALLVGPAYREFPPSLLRPRYYANTFFYWELYKHLKHQGAQIAGIGDEERLQALFVYRFQFDNPMAPQWSTPTAGHVREHPAYWVYAGPYFDRTIAQSIAAAQREKKPYTAVLIGAMHTMYAAKHLGLRTQLLYDFPQEMFDQQQELETLHRKMARSGPPMAVRRDAKGIRRP